MNCPHCEATSKALVLESRRVEGDILRRRLCGVCSKTYVTREYADSDLRIPTAPKAKPVKTVRGRTDNTLFGVWK